MTLSGFVAADWELPGHIVAGTTTRNGGASSNDFASLNMGAHVGDDPDRVRANRERLRESLDLPASPAWLRQVHGSNVIEAPFDQSEPEADACWTTAVHQVCVVMTADCLPVLFSTANGRCIAAAHAGWRGLASGILEATVSAMAAEPRDLHAWLGPAISQPAFEVGDEVRAAFVASDPGADACFSANDRRRWQADLYGLARRRLAALGIARVSGGDRCTYREPNTFYSYRRDGRCGRMATLIFRRESPANA